MKKLFDWIRNNKLAFILLLVVLYLLFKPRLLRFSNVTSLVAPKSKMLAEEALDYDMVGAPALEQSRGVGGIIPAPESAPVPEAEERMVVEESYVSMLVDDVRQSVDQVISKGGYMVSSNLSQPEQAPFATVVLRIPQPELRSALEHLRGLAVRVTSENLQGKDVTDQYTDLEARLETLNKTKVKFEDILNQATKVQDILEVQRQLIYIQDQIDSLKGRQEYLEKTAANAKLTVYLSSDEWSLPYAPEKPFRAKVIFKQAVRSLVTTVRGLAKLSIWVLSFGFEI
jgi:broad-specificity NMP kinase